MKTSIALLTLLFSFSGFACVEEVQKQIEEVYNTSYFLEISSQEEKQLKDLHLISEFIFVADESALENPETAAYAADSSAPGCYGYEYVLFDKKDCRLLAFGGGFCD
jgi:hypothetical protein